MNSSPECKYPCRRSIERRLLYVGLRLRASRGLVHTASRRHAAVGVLRVKSPASLQCTPRYGARLEGKGGRDERTDRSRVIRYCPKAGNLHSTSLTPRCRLWDDGLSAGVVSRTTDNGPGGGVLLEEMTEGQVEKSVLLYGGGIRARHHPACRSGSPWGDSGSIWILANK